MRTLPSLQRGATPIMTLVWILIFVSVATLCVKLIPVYIDDFAVASSLEGLQRETRLPEFSDKEVLATLDKFFSLNNVRDFDKDSVELIREGDAQITVKVNYEVRTNVVRNIDTVVSFSHEVTVRKS